MSDPVAVYRLCAEALIAADDWTQSAPDRHWVMDLDWYKKIRAAAKPLGGGEDEDDDPDKWVPNPGDTLFGRPIEVRDDGGEPHLEAESPRDMWSDEPVSLTRQDNMEQP